MYGVKLLFSTLLNAYNDFVSDERVVWVDIEGIPLHVLSRETLPRWQVFCGFGEGTIFTWNPSFLEPKESCLYLRRRIKAGLLKFLMMGRKNSDVESDDECNVDGVSETIFSDNVDECNVDGHASERRVPLYHHPTPSNPPGLPLITSVTQLLMLGILGGILCIWEASIFKKDGATISDNFIAIYGTWLPRNVKILLVAVYAPQQPGSKRALWDFLSNLVRRWNGEAIIMGDFNDVRTMDERLVSSFNVSSARCFDRFIVSSGLVDVKLEGYSFTWSHPSASKMSKLDRFLVTEGIISLYPSISALCLDRHLSDHRPILLREVLSDFGPKRSRFVFLSIMVKKEGFDSMVEHAWLSFSHSDSNAMVRFKKKLQVLKSIIRLWVKDKKFHLHNAKNSLQNDLISIDKDLERGNVSDDILLNRMDLNRRLQDIKLLEVKDLISWVAWDNVLASKLNGGLGVSSFFALNRALLLKWVWRFISGDGSLWCKVIQAIYGSKKRIGDGSCTSFWYDIWLADAPLCVQFPRLFALELDKEIVVANKMGASSVSASFRRDVRDGAERQQWDDLSSIMNSVVLSSSKDRWTCDLSGDGEFKVKVIRNFIDDLFLPSTMLQRDGKIQFPLKLMDFSGCSDVIGYY
ncbi:RNA-directed DNA polymerase, eukaryota [Tanacetum coccineum]